ncbi:hypothetical protein [Symbioplanes lichenis]|uniref:hypothetical protein n=1 Tax=Symbioplanes lichenis TaxID=1629072 RepID=UPI0027389509|nr:hypothetical protein [Actinoplanes lichenis]
MNRRLVAVLVPVVALGLTACTGDDPKTELQESTSGLQAGNYNFSVAMPGGSSAKSVVHKPSHTASIDYVSKTADGDATVNLRFVEPDRFMKLTADMGDSAKQLQAMQAAGGTDPADAKLVQGLQSMVDMFSGKTWMKVDMSKVTENAELKVDFANPDLTGVSDLLKTASTAEREDDVITGKLDVTAAGDDTHLLGQSAFAGVDATAGKAVPFEATLDGDGRLTKLVLDMPKTSDAEAGKWTVEVSQYGSAAQQEAPPADQVQEAPDSAYEMLNS